MDFSEILHLSDSTSMVSSTILYIIAGIGALLLILLIVWLLFKISELFNRKSGEPSKKKDLSDEEQLFGD